MVDLNFQKYPAYKSSGVEWLGNIPEHWEVRRLKYLVSEKLKYGANEEANSEDKSQPRYIRITDFDENGKLRDNTFKSLEINLAKDYLLSEGDILFARSGATVGKTFQFKDYSGLACFAGYLIKAVPKKSIILSDYLYLFTKSKSYDSWKSSIFIQATIQNIEADKYSCLFVPLPPISEQQAIANFLDEKLAQIDDYIAKKQRMIELLKEQKTVIINRAVTKGLNPDVPMKFSGIEWLGEIPEHWEVRKIKRCLKSYRYGISDSIRGEGEFKILTMGNIQDGKVLIPETGSLESVPEELILEYGDLLFNRTNSLELVGKVGFFRGSKEDKVSFASYLVRLKANDDANPVYLNFLLNSHGLLNVARQRALVSLNQVNLNPTRYCQLTIPLPPISEQQEIVSFIQKKSEKIERSLAIIEKEIKLILEYRTSLISETVTGKIDVRKYRPPNQKSKTFSE